VTMLQRFGAAPAPTASPQEQPVPYTAYTVHS